MQDRYAGDVGDFGKYALLRRLCGTSEDLRVKLGIVWCYFPNEAHNSDGKHISYLHSAGFKNLDDELHAALSEIISAGQRTIDSIVSAGVLPRGTVSCARPVTPVERCSPQERLSQRKIWLANCLQLTFDCDLVFLDPDNGLEILSVRKDHPKAGKYIFWDEISCFWSRKHTLLIYHHLNRRAPAAWQIRLLNNRFSAELERSVVVPLVFRRGSSRVFWLVHHGDALGRELERRAADFLKSGWSRHFRPLGWPANDQAETTTE